MLCYARASYGGTGPPSQRSWVEDRCAAGGARVVGPGGGAAGGPVLGRPRQPVPGTAAAWLGGLAICAAGARAAGGCRSGQGVALAGAVWRAAAQLSAR